MSNQTPFKLTPLAAAIAAVLYPSQPALAQEQEEEFELEEVIVTATLRETTLQEVPQSISAFTGADIEKYNIQSLEDIVRALPSLGLVATQPGRNDLVYRGVSTGSQEFYTDSQIAVYVDETPMSLNSQQAFPRMVDIERLESLPGPQGTLFGAASQTGTLRVITNKPNFDGVSGQVFAELATTRGGEASYEFNGWVNIPLGDSFALRAVAYYVKEGGYIDNVLGETFVGPVAGGPQFETTNASVVEEDFNDSELVGGRIAALWQVNDNWSVTGTIITEHLENSGWWQSDPSLGDFEIARFHDELRDDDWTIFGLTIQGDLGFATLTSNTSYFERTIRYEWDNMYYEQYKDSFYGFYYGYDLYNTLYSFGIIFNDQNQDRFSQEVRLASQSDSRLQWMVGLYYEDLHDDWFYGATNPYLLETPAWAYAEYAQYWNYYYGYPVQYPLQPTNLAYTNFLDRDLKQKSVFGELTFDLTDSWRVTGGIRWFEYKRFFSDQNFFPDNFPPPGSADTNGLFITESKTDDVLFKFSTQYQITEDKMVYFLYSQGFRLGGNNPGRAVESGVAPQTYKPDTMDNFELGLKSQWFDNRLLLNATLFHMKWKDYQQGGSPGPWWLIATFNAADAENTGLELSGSFQVTEHFSLNYSGTWANPKFSENYTFPWGQAIYEGMTMPHSPKRKFYLGANWVFPGAFGTEEMFLNYNWSYQASVYNQLGAITDEDVEGIIPSWDLSNLTVGARFKGDWSLTLVVRNLFDQKAIVDLDGQFQRSVSDWFGTTSYRNKRTYTRPRTIGLQLRKNF